MAWFDSVMTLFKNIMVPGAEPVILSLLILITVLGLLSYTSIKILIIKDKQLNDLNSKYQDALNLAYEKQILSINVVQTTLQTQAAVMGELRVMLICMISGKNNVSRILLPSEHGDD